MNQKIQLSKINLNNGQLEGVPKNPRFIKDDKFERLKKSIQEDPEMIELRELIVVPHEDKYVCIAGNMRLRALRELGYKEAPCKVIDYDDKKLRAIATKDNIPYGEWDWDIIANNWDTTEFNEWGLDLQDWHNISEEDLDDEFTLPEGERDPFKQMTITLADEQAEFIENAISDIKKTEEYKYCETFGNQNSNGNALYLIVASWAGQRK